MSFAEEAEGLIAAVAKADNACSHLERRSATSARY